MSFGRALEVLLANRNIQMGLGRVFGGSWKFYWTTNEITWVLEVLMDTKNIFMGLGWVLEVLMANRYNSMGLGSFHSQQIKFHGSWK